MFKSLRKLGSKIVKAVQNLFSGIAAKFKKKEAQPAPEQEIVIPKVVVTSSVNETLYGAFTFGELAVMFTPETNTTVESYDDSKTTEATDHCEVDATVEVVTETPVDVKSEEVTPVVTKSEEHNYTGCNDVIVGVKLHKKEQPAEKEFRKPNKAKCNNPAKVEKESRRDRNKARNLRRQTGK